MRFFLLDRKTSLIVFLFTSLIITLAPLLIFDNREQDHLFFSHLHTDCIFIHKANLWTFYPCETATYIYYFRSFCSLYFLNFPYIYVFHKKKIFAPSCYANSFRKRYYRSLHLNIWHRRQMHVELQTQTPFDEDKLCGTVMAENRLEIPASCISKSSQRSNLLRFQTVASSRPYGRLNSSSLPLIEINGAGPPLEHFVQVNDVSHSCVTRQQQLCRRGKTTENLHPFFRIFRSRAKRNYPDIRFGVSARKARAARCVHVSKRVVRGNFRVFSVNFNGCAPREVSIEKLCQCVKRKSV